MGIGHLGSVVKNDATRTITLGIV